MESAVIKMPFEGNLSRYLQEIRKFPMLSPEEELRAVARLARQRGYGGGAQACHLASASGRQDRDGLSRLRPADRRLISEGNVGMMQAVKRFDPDRGFRLATYAMGWIRAAVQEYILRSSLW